MRPIYFALADVSPRMGMHVCDDVEIRLSAVFPTMRPAHVHGRLSLRICRSLDRDRHSRQKSRSVSAREIDGPGERRRFPVGRGYGASVLAAGVSKEEPAL